MIKKRNRNLAKGDLSKNHVHSNHKYLGNKAKSKNRESPLTQKHEKLQSGIENEVPAFTLPTNGLVVGNIITSGRCNSWNGMHVIRGFE